MKATAALALATLCAGAITCPAAVVLDNLSLDDNNSWPIISGEYLAQSFRVGNGATGYTIDALQIQIHSVENSTAPLVFSIYTDSANQPGTSVGQLTAGAPPTGEGTYTFTPTTSFVLDGATNYWIVASTTGAGHYYWSLSTEIGYVTQDNWSIDETQFTLAYSSNAGTSWDIYSGGSEGVGAGLFAISATPVPEPSASALLLGAATLLLSFRSRRRD